MSSKNGALVIAAVIILTLCAPQSVAGQRRDRSSLEALVDSLGSGALAMAWPTAAYRDAEFKEIRADGSVVFVIYAKSGWDGSDLWLEVIYSTADGKMRWGRHNGFWPPGAAGVILTEILKEASKPAPEVSTGDKTAVTLTWTLVDRCADGKGLRVRFFDEDNNLLWPDSEHVYLIQAGGSRRFDLSARRGTKICYGAESDGSNSSSYWGVGTDNEKSCSNCCLNADNFSKSFDLTCS